MTRPLPCAAPEELAAAEALTTDLQLRATRMSRSDRALEVLVLALGGLLAVVLLIAAVCSALLVLFGLLMLAITAARWVPWPLTLVAGGVAVGAGLVRAGAGRGR